MAAKKQQTHAKKARELAVKERRERKRAKKAEVAAQRAAGIVLPAENGDGGIAVPVDEGDAEIAPREWVR